MSTYMYLVVGCSAREIFDYRTVEREVTKFDCDTGEPKKIKYSETTIYFGDEVIVPPKERAEHLIEKFINKNCGLYVHVDSELIYEDIESGSEYGSTHIDIEKMLFAKKCFKKDIHEKFNKLVNPKFYLVARSTYDY